VQNAIAEAAGVLEIGQVGTWHVAEKLPLTDRYGKVEAVRAFGGEIRCRDIVFTVEEEEDFYSATICRNGEGLWRWATAEPAVDRWHGFQ
jgi:hypothetical protein